jgi:RNA polymerase sigma-70 factor (ECF subfamily)
VRDFRQAWEAQDIQALIDILDPDATAIGDGGGLVTAALEPIVGGERVARYFADLAARATDMRLLERTVNGQPGLVGEVDGAVGVVITFDIVDGRITHIWAVRNPEKLRPWSAN